MQSFINSLYKKTTNASAPVTRSYLQKSYSTHKTKYPSLKPKDSKALNNNPPVKDKHGNTVRHLEVTRQECSEPDCNNKICSKTCGNIIREVTIGHLTKGVLKNKEGETYNISNTDINGNPVPQQIFVYNEAHNTDPSQVEILKGTKHITNNAIEQFINSVEDKK